MPEVIDRWTNKPRPAWTLENRFRESDPCEHCEGTEVILDCPRCGAPICCYTCCDEAAKPRSQ